MNSIVGSENVVDHVLSVRLGSHPVTEEEGGEERDEHGVVVAKTGDPDVESPANDP